MALLQLAPRRALRAARILANDPDDLPQVFTIIESLSLDTMLRTRLRLWWRRSGRQLLRERGDIVPLLADRQTLAQLPAGSLGRAYLDFVEREGISAEGIIAANRAGVREEAALPPAMAWVHARLRDTHDLWHAATGYHGDIVGETALLAFTFAQLWNPALALIIGIGLYKMRALPGATTTILDGFRRGWRARWLPAERWESLLALPLDQVRRRLGLESPARYQTLRTSDFAL